MSGNHPIRTLAFAMLALLLASPIGRAETLSRLSTRFLARGEKALLEVAVSSVVPNAALEITAIPHVEGVDITSAQEGWQPNILPGRRLENVFYFYVSSYAVGSHTIPPIEVRINGGPTRTEPIEFTVFNPDELKWSEASAGDIPFRYASAFRVMNPSPYDGETTPVEIKIFVPADLFVVDWGIPDFKRDGVTAWRFQPSIMKGQINLLGMPYVSVAYPSTLTPNRGGKVGIGPATIRLMTTQVVMDGVMRRVPVESNISVPKLELDSVPLPEGAPEGFENAIGSFKLQTSTAQREVQEGDPISVDILVTGSGNLDTLRPPKPVDATGWKMYDAAADQRDDVRRELSGSTLFHQFMRPLELKPAVPAFRLAYFDPKEKTYKTVTTEPILLTMKPTPVPKAGATAPPALQVPVERMTDILGVLQPASLTLSGTSGLPRGFWHAVAASIALALILKALWMRFSPRFRKDPIREARTAALREIERIDAADGTGFLKAAGSFIERWLGENPSPEVTSVLVERDTLCFREDSGKSAALDSKRRNDILRTLRKAALLWIAVILLDMGTGEARAADTAAQARTAYDEARFDEAISFWLKAGPYEDLAPDTLYNIGNACYRAGSPGYAALYYRRAISRDPGHQESRQNLRFIERKYGSISIHRPDYQYALAKFPLSAWQGMVWTGAWLCGLAVLVFPATRSGAKLRIAALAALVVGPLVAACGGLGWRYYPNDAEFAPIARQAVFIGEKAVLHADAARTSPEVIDAPPGSLCEVIRETGRWAYVSFATKTRGWVPVDAIEKVIPTSPPVPPTIRKPKADGKSA